MKQILEIVIKHKMIFLVGSLLFAFPFFVCAPFVKTVDNVDYFTLENNADVEIYNNIKEVFGNDEFFVIAFQKKDMFTSDNLELLKGITQKIEEIEEVREVKSLANIDDTLGEENYFEIRKFLETIPKNPDKLELLKKQAVNNPLYVNNLISKNGKTAAIVVFTFDRPEDENYRKVLMSKCQTILKTYEDQGTDFWIAGWTVTNLYLSQYLKKDIAVFIPLTYVLITLCVYIILGNIRLTLLALANISITMGSTMGLFFLSGTTMNNVTSIVPPLIMALALCDTIHIFSHMEKKVLYRFQNKEKALLHVLQTVFTPCFLTTLTTAVGFISLYVSDIPPIREFALMASAGMIFEFLFSFFFLPSLILLFPPEKVFIEYSEQKWMPLLLNRIHLFVKKYSKIVVVISIVAVAGALWLGASIKVETNLLEYFKQKSPVRISLSHVERELSGISTVDISLKSNEVDAFKIPENLHVIEKIQNHINAQKGVDVSTSFVDFVKDINQSFHNEDNKYYTIPESGALISQYMLLYDSDDINDFINNDYNHARISARTHLYSSFDQKQLVENIKQFVLEIEKSGLEIEVSGRAVQDVNTIDSLVSGQIVSLGIAAGIIFIVIFIVLRSVKIGFLSIIPNLFPIILNFGIMGAFNIPLNTATSLISAVAIGIAVDDTIHFLFEYKEQRDSGRNISEALDRVMMRKGRAILTSSFILSIGFGVMIFSSFIPIVSFGVLSAVIMITAVVGDLIVLPSVLYLHPDSKYRPQVP